MQLMSHNILTIKKQMITVAVLFWMPKAMSQTIPSGPLTRQPISQFRFLKDSELFALHGFTDTQRINLEMRNLRAQMIGTAKEKKKINKFCEQKWKLNPSEFKLTESNLSCSFWALQEMVQQRERTEKKQVLLSKKLSAKQLAPIDRTKLKRITALKAIRNQADWDSLQYIEYTKGRGFFKFRNLEEANKVAVFALKNPSECATTSARISFFRKVEEYLPDEKAWGLMQQVYMSMLPCLPTSPDKQAEIVHLRMGLLSLERGDSANAIGMLDRALVCATPSEEYRSLFWRGFVEALPFYRNDWVAEHENKYMATLLQKYPLTFHAIVADAMISREFYNRLASKPVPYVSLYAGDNWNEYNLTSFLFSLLISKDETIAVKRLSRFTNDHIAPLDFESGFFLSKAHMQAGNAWSSINTAFTTLREFGMDQLNVDIVESLYPPLYRHVVLKHSKAVEPELSLALMRQESTFNVTATSPVGARGLMQIMPLTAQHVMRRSNVNLYDPAQNVEAGSKFLSRLIKKYDTRPYLSLAAYNAGPGNADQWLERYFSPLHILFSDLIPFAESRNYISGILRNRYWYHIFLKLPEGPLPRSIPFEKDQTSIWTPIGLRPLRSAFDQSNVASGSPLFKRASKKAP